MRKIIFYFIAAALILTLGSAGLAQGLPSLTESSSTPSPVTPSTNIAPSVPVAIVSADTLNIFSYADPSCSFSFNFPDNWKEYEQVEGTLKAELDFWEEEYLLASFFVYVKDTDLSLSQYAMQEEEWMMNPQNMADYRKISEEAINIGNLPAIQRLYTYTFITNNNVKIPLKAIDVYIVNNNKSYMLVGEVDLDKFEGILTDLSVMFNSFVITEEPVSASTVPGLPPITVSDTSSIIPAIPTVPIGSETVIKFCPYCGVPLQPNYKFCPGCGEPIPVQRVIKEPKEEETRSDRRNNIDYPANPLQKRGFSEEINRLDQIKGMNKSINKPLNAFQPALISQGFGSKLVRIFPNKPLFPWAVSSRIVTGHYNYGGLIPGSIGRKISSQLLITKSINQRNLNISFLEGLGEKIAFNPNLGVAYRGGGIDQLGSSLKNLGEGINTKMVVSQAPSLEKTWILRSVKRSVKENISMGSSIKRLASKIGTSLVDQARSPFSFGEYFSALGQGITYETGPKREAETLPSLTSASPQTTPTLPVIPPSIGSEGIAIPTPEAPAQGGITLTPPGQPVPAQPGPGGIVLPTPGTPQEPQIIWKQYSLNQAFSHNPLITGYLEYPSTWLVNLDSFNRNVTFSEDGSGLTSLTLFPGLMGQFSSAQDLAQQMTQLLQQQVADLSILNQEFKIVPTPGSGAIEVTEGKLNLQGNYQGATFRFNIETYVIYTGVYGPASGMGYVILTQTPQNIFTEKEQKYFNRMILSYKRALGVVK
jgi:hypothetical protein